jgi:MFS family permease
LGPRIDGLEEGVGGGKELEKLVGKWNSYIVALFLLGAASGGVLFGWLGDKIGRVRAMMLSILAYSLFTGCCYFARAPWHLGSLRFLAALGMGGEWSLGVALVMEYWPEKLRPLMAGVIGAAGNVGYLLIAVVAGLIPVTPDSWRWLFLVGALPALLVIFIQICVPESQRWKESVQKDAAKPLREIIFGRGLRKATLLAILFAAIPLIATWGGVTGFLPLWADQLGGRGNPHAKAMAQIFISIGAIIGCVVAPLVGGKVGRRPTYFALCLAALLCCQYLFREDWQYGLLFLTVSGVAGCLASAFYGWLPLYLPELFPTRVRATGQGLSYNFGRVVTAAGVLGTGQMMAFFDGSYPRACSAITLVYVLGLVLIWLAPETKGRPLPD